TVQVYMPRVEQPDRRSVRPRDSDLLPPPAAATILIFEDNQTLRTVVARILGAAGYRLLVAAEPDDARRICREHRGPIDLLLTEVGVLGTTGPSLADELTTSRPEMKVLFMSEPTRPSSAQRGSSSSEYFFLERPLTPESIIRRVRTVITDLNRSLLH